LKGKDISFAGIITEVRNGTTKTGNPYSTVTFEDFSDSLKLMFFSKDYLEYSKYFNVGYALYLKGKVQPKPFGENPELEIKIKSIVMLANVREDMVKSISIIVPVQMVTDKLITEIKTYTNQSKGKVELKFKIVDKSENLFVDLYSRNQRIELSDEFISYLHENVDIDFKLN